jgi:hypothetical protein
MDYERRITQHKRFVPYGTHPNSAFGGTSFMLEPIAKMALRLNVFDRRLIKSIMGKRRTVEDERIYRNSNDVHILAIGLATKRGFSL